jgi:hypothetical protein
MGITMTITAECPEELFSTIKGCALMVADGVPAAVPQTPVASPTPAPVAIPANGVPQAAPSAPVTPVPVQTSAPPVGQTAPVGYPAASVPVTPPPSTLYYLLPLPSAGYTAHQRPGWKPHSRTRPANTPQKVRWPTQWRS